jgi:hypothetical protein
MPISRRKKRRRIKVGVVKIVILIETDYENYE